MSSEIRNASIIDVIGAPVFKGELWLEGERIVSISSVPNTPISDLEIDANLIAVTLYTVLDPRIRL